MTEGDASPLVRTDFTSDAAWRHLVELACKTSPDGFQARLRLVEDRRFDGADTASLVAADWQGAVVLFVADAHAMDDCECSLLCVDLSKRPGRAFRCVPGALWGVENNLRLGNMDFEEFVEAAGSGDTFRGF